MKHRTTIESLEDVFHNERETEPFLEYVVYRVDAHGSIIQDPEALLQLKASIEQAIILPHIQDYIWTKQSFLLQPTLLKDENKDVPTSGHITALYGVTRYADNVDDEWLIIRLLVEISRQYIDTIIRYTTNTTSYT
jgi:hypothetical protein